MEQRSKRLGEGNKTRMLARDMSESLGKIPPSAIDLEEAVLGAMLLESVARFEVIGSLRAEDFYLEQHKEIFQAMFDLYHSDRPIDLRSVFARLRQNGKAEIVGGATYLAELQSKVSQATNMEEHARVLIEYKIKRDMIQIASKTHHDAYEDTSDAIELLEKVQQDLDNIGGKYLKGNFRSAGELAKEFIESIISKREHKGLTGEATGYELLDRITGGWQKTDLIIIAARPGMGKTAFLLSAALNSSIRFQIPTAVFSLEMSSKQLMARAISSESDVVNERIFKNYFNDEELSRMKQAASKKIAQAPLYIDDTPAITIYEFRARARRLVHEKGVKQIYVDYLQLMNGDHGGNRDQEIGSISRGLKRVAKELNVPVIALAQLSRGVETRGGDKRPQLSDLRESGSIEQDADIVAFLYRAEYYKITELADGRSSQSVMEIILAKHRNGSLDTIPLKFIGKFTRVTNWEEFAPPTNDQGAPLRRLDSGYTSLRNPGEPEEKTDDYPF